MSNPDAAGGRTSPDNRDESGDANPKLNQSMPDVSAVPDETVGDADASPQAIQSTPVISLSDLSQFRTDQQPAETPDTSAEAPNSGRVGFGGKLRQLAHSATVLLPARLREDQTQKRPELKKRWTKILHVDLEEQAIANWKSDLNARESPMLKSRSVAVPSYGAADSVSYNAASLSSMKTLWHFSFTVWKRPALWTSALVLIATALNTAFMVMLVISNPSDLDPSKFHAITQILNSFVGLLLGFFMSTSMGRWYGCMNGFLDVFDSVRALQRHLYSLGVPQEYTEEILRYGVLASRMLTVDLHVKATQIARTADLEIEEMWSTIQQGTGTFNRITPDEMAILKACADPPGTIWTWVALMIGRLSQDGWIPPMASPTYSAICGHIEKARKGTRDARTSTFVTPPFIYVQMLASLVHINNLMDAVSFGMTLGISLATAVQQRGWGFYHQEHRASAGDVARDSQDVLLAMFFGFFGPLIYQALLEVSIAIAQPFSSEDGEIPTRWLLHNLERDLIDAKMAAARLPKGWKQAHFKAPPVTAPAAATSSTISASAPNLLT